MITNAFAGADKAGAIFDGLGLLGSGDHSADEYLLESSLPRYTRRLASVLGDLVAEMTG